MLSLYQNISNNMSLDDAIAAILAMELSDDNKLVHEFQELWKAFETSNVPRTHKLHGIHSGGPATSMSFHMSARVFESDNQDNHDDMPELEEIG